MQKIAMSRLDELFEAISNSYGLYMPIEKGSQVNYDKWSKDAKYRFDILNTVKSAKDLFFPQTEPIVSFKTQGKKFEITPAKRVDEDFVVFGVRACDAKSFNILDMVFLYENTDTFYKARREHGVVVTMACNEPEETCFCTTFGIDPTQPKGDVETFIVGDTLYWNELTEKGKALTQKLSGLLEKANDSDVDSKKKEIKSILDKLPLKGLSLEGWDGNATEAKFKAPEWKALSDSCLGCGTCTFVCPTCQCYDIKDYDTGHGVQRYRCWDSCMFSDFTMAAHGTNRPTQLQRFRQRFMHKLVYFPANNKGEYSCVGCGRCVAKCPISMNIVKVIKTVGGNK